MGTARAPGARLLVRRSAVFLGLLVPSVGLILLATWAVLTLQRQGRPLWVSVPACGIVLLLSGGMAWSAIRRSSDRFDDITPKVVGIDVVATRLGNSKGFDRTVRFMANMSGTTYSRGGPPRLTAHLSDVRRYWEAEFRHHARRYPYREIRLLAGFLGQVVERGEASRLGDPAWVFTVVERLRYTPRSLPWARKAAIKQILDDC